MELVQEVRKPKSNNPGIQIIYSVPKVGKTTIVSALEDHLVLELEQGGADYVSGRVQEITKPSEFNECLTLIKNSEKQVCTYLVVDTVTKLDEWSEIVGTYNYMNKPQGKKFNREGDDPQGKKILHNDRRFETVHEIPQGYGYQHSRLVMTDWYDQLVELITLGKVKHIILLAHVKDKLIETKNGNTVEHIELNLTGKVKSIFSSRVDAIGHLKRIGNECYITYGGDEKVISGGRCAHLTDEILISEKGDDGKIITHWDKIYLK
jgi:hypothetical protein